MDRYEFLWRTSPTLDCVHHVSGRAWDWRYWTIPAGWKGTQSSRSAGSARDHRYGASRESTILLTLQSMEELGSMKKRKWGETEWRDRHTASEDRTVNMLIDGYGPRCKDSWGLAKAIPQMEMKPCSETGRYTVSAWLRKCESQSLTKEEKINYAILVSVNWVRQHRQHTTYIEQE